ncbi:MAG: ABC transporter ATP-binding protein, partial [Clostridia bacterium]|nr:ABC transporter ATP-binding protein [Clostridia bacterium]
MAKDSPRKDMKKDAPQMKAKKGTLKRLFAMLFSKNKPLLAVIVVCIVVSSVTGVASSFFLKKLLDAINAGLNYSLVDGLTGDQALDKVLPTLIKIFVAMGGVYLINVLCAFLYTRLGAVLTQKFLHQVRTRIFDKMQSLPINYFDSHKTGDLMSVYTNDTDALRELVSQSIPHLLSASISLITLLVLMFSYSVWLSLVIFAGVFVMFRVTKTVGGKSAKYFIRRQAVLGKEEGFIEEMMQGGKVVKVFCHEKESMEEFDKRNEELCETATKATTFANILMPIMGNLGNILYVFVAFVGGLLTILNVPNLSFSGLDYGAVNFIIVIMAFLPVSRQFTGNISQSSQQINSIVMGLAGASRVFDILDEKPETDDGYVTLVNCTVDNDGNISESTERTG